jgi:hypothetical protein
MVLSMPILGLLAMAMRHTNTVGKGGARIANKVLGFGNDPGRNCNLDCNQFIATIATYSNQCIQPDLQVFCFFCLDGRRWHKQIGIVGDKIA